MERGNERSFYFPFRARKYFSGVIFTDVENLTCI